MKKMERYGSWCLIALGAALPLSTAATTLLLYATGLCWLLGGNWKEKCQQALNHTLVRGCLVLIALYGIGLLYAQVPWSERGLGLYQALKWGWLFFWIPFCQDSKTTERALWTFVAASCLSLGYSLFVPLESAFKDYIVTGYFAAIAAYWAALNSLQGEVSQRYRWMYAGLALGLLIATVCFARGRTNYVVMVFLVLFFAFQQARWKGVGAAFIGLICLLGGALFFSPQFSARIKGLTEQWETGMTSDPSIRLRVEFLEESWKLVRVHPWFGWGTGSFSRAYAEQAQADGIAQLTNNPHNEYLFVGVELGLWGLGILGFFFHRIWACSRRLTRINRRFIEGFIGAFLLACLFNSFLRDFSSRYCFMWMLALFFSTTPSPYVQPNFKAVTTGTAPCPPLH